MVSEEVSQESGRLDLKDMASTVNLLMVDRPLSACTQELGNPLLSWSSNVLATQEDKIDEDKQPMKKRRSGQTLD